MCALAASELSRDLCISQEPSASAPLPVYCGKHSPAPGMPSTTSRSQGPRVVSSLSDSLVLGFRQSIEVFRRYHRWLLSPNGASQGSADPKLLKVLGGIWEQLYKRLRGLEERAATICRESGVRHPKPKFQPCHFQTMVLWCERNAK